jgi:hypothetical protein
MSWVTWIAMLVAWPVLGLGIAYLFGSLIRGAEAPDDAGDLVPPVLSYLRREKRAKASGTREIAPAKGRGGVAGGHQVH